jgi:MFS family permease
MDTSKKLFSIEFVAINLIIFLNYCNIALFFHFTSYLGSISIAPEWFGFLIGIFSLVILLLRPVISPFSNAYNSRKWIGVSTFFVIISLLLYGVANSVISMAIVRIFHAIAYVVLTVAVTSRMVLSIPREKSSLAFSIISVISLMPYAIIPPAVVYLTAALESFQRVLAVAGLMMALTYPLLVLIPDDSDSVKPEARSPLSLSEMKTNLRNICILVVLGISVVVWTTYAPVFYFLNDFGVSIGVSNPGLFFTISSLSEIGVRLIGGGLMDRENKTGLLVYALMWLAVCYLAMVFVRGSGMFYLMGLLMGVGWGLIMPLLSSIVFDLSEPRFRAFNTNLTFQMFQLGFFVGPVFGAPLVEHGRFDQLFFSGSLMLVMVTALSFFIFRRHMHSLRNA